MCTQVPMRPGSSISVWNSLISDFPSTSCPLKKAYFNALCILCLTSSLILAHTCTPGCASFSSIIWQRRWIFSYICELNENKAPLLSVLCSWSFAKNNVGFINCVGLKMLSWCQTTYQDAGLHMFLIFQLFVLSFLVSQRLMKITSTMKQKWSIGNSSGSCIT